MSATPTAEGASNSISGGTVLGPVMQAGSVTMQAPSPPPTALAGLPRTTDTFVGRSDDLAALLAGLAPRGERPDEKALTTLTGPPGVGKTELALQAADTVSREQPTWFPGGTLFLDLFGYDKKRRMSPEQALEHLLRALGVPGEHIPPTLDGRELLYRSQLAARAKQGARVLIILDNAATEEQVRPLLPSDEGTAVLVTSRHTLDLGGRIHELDVLPVEQSVDMIRQVLRRSRGGTDTRVDDQLPYAERLVALCGSLPLALQICAALLADSPRRPLSSLCEALAEAQGRLDGLRREDRAVRAAFELSYRFLPEPERRLFRLLCLAPGPDLSTATASVLANAAVPDVETLLRRLARAHLIAEGAVWGRWRMHDLIRLYAEECDIKDGTVKKTNAAVRRLYKYLWTQLSYAEGHLRSRETPDGSSRFPTGEAAMAWFEGERTVLVAACLETFWLFPRNTGRFAALLTPFLDRYRHLDDWVAVSTAAVNAATKVEDRAEESRALHLLGLALREVGRPEQAVRVHERELSLCRTTGDRSGEALGLDGLGMALRHLGKAEESVIAHEEAVRITTKIEGPHARPGLRMNLGNALRQAGRPEAALPVFSAAIEAARAGEHHREEALALANLAGALTELGRPAEALPLCEASLRLCDRLPDPYVGAIAQTCRGMALAEMTRDQDAVDAFSHAVDVLSRSGDRIRECGVLLSLAELHRRHGRTAEATSVLFRAAQVARASQGRHVLAHVLTQLAEVLEETARWEEVRDVLAEALHVHQATGDLESQAGVLAWLGELYAGTGQLSAAAAIYTHLVAICRNLEEPPLAEAAALLQLSPVLQALGRTEECVRVAGDAAELYRAAGEDEREAFALMDLATGFAILGRSTEALKTTARAIDLIRTPEDPAEPAHMWQNIGAHLIGHDSMAAADAARRAAAVFHDLGDALGEGRCLHNLALAQLVGNDIDSAIRSGEEALVLLRTTDDRLAVGQALQNLGAALLKSGSFAAAAEAFGEAIGIYRALGEGELEQQARDLQESARAQLNRPPMAG
ncbi:tetratricopeptide repeat protein [Streptomyces prunicolor]